MFCGACVEISVANPSQKPKAIACALSHTFRNRNCLALKERRNGWKTLPGSRQPHNLSQNIYIYIGWHTEINFSPIQHSTAITIYSIRDISGPSLKRIILPWRTNIRQKNFVLYVCFVFYR